VGGLSAAVDGGIYAGLVALGVNPVVASPVSFLTSVLVNYFANRQFVFRSRRRGAYWRYATLVGLNLVLGTGIVAAGVMIGMHPLLAKLVSMVVIVVFNYVSMRNWVFAAPRRQPSGEQSDPSRSAR
jgi:putative flippase GtrA